MTKKFKNCPRFKKCSINLCPLDFEARFKKVFPGENTCPFMIKKKNKFQKGIRTLAPDSILKVIPKLNIKMLNKRNQKRWHALHKKNATE